MARFNPTLTDRENQFSQYSRGSIPNQAFESLFKGAAQVGEGLINAADQNVQGNIRRDVEQEHDAALDAYGVNAMADIGASSTGPTPKLPDELAERKAFMETLTESWQSGGLSESHYFGRLTDVVKRLRAKYPGYREQIDNIVADVTGVNPANALAASIRSDLNAEMAEKEKGKLNFENYMSQNEGDVDPVLRERYFSGDHSPEIERAIRLQVSSVKSERIQREDNRQRMAFDAEKDQLQEETALENLTEEVTQDINRSLRSSTYIAGVDFDSFIKNAQAAQADGSISGDEEQALRQQIQQMKFGLTTMINKKILEPWQDGSEYSYASIITDKTKLDSVRDLVNQQVAPYEDMLTNQHYGILGANQAYIDATTSSKTVELLNKNPIWAVAAAISKLGGSEVFNTILLKAPGFQNAITQASEASLIGQVMTGETTVADGVSQLSAITKKDPVSIKFFIDSTIESLLDPRSPLKMQENLANSIFGENNGNLLLKFSKDDRIKILQMLASGDVTKKMIELGKSNPEQMNNYQNWIKTQFNIIFREDAARLQDIVEGTNGQGDIVFDESSFQLEKNFDVNMSDPNYDDITALTQETALDLEVQNLNKYLKVIQPVITANGEDPNQVAEELFGVLGLEMDFEENNPIDNQKEEQQGSLTPEDFSLASTATAFHNFVSEAEGTGEGTRGYNETLDRGKYTGGDVELTSMTLDEIDALQTQMLQHPDNPHNSSALGRYMIVQQTLRGLRDELGLEGTDLFDEALQDQLATALQNRRGRNVGGLRNEWAGLRKKGASEILMAYDG